VPRNRVGRSGEAYLSPAAVFAFLVLFFISCLSLAGCGLESSVYYSLPTFYISGNSFPVTLTHNTANSDSSFLGYDVYYRVYFDPNAATTDLAVITAVNDINSYTPSSALAKLRGMGFVRLQSLGQTTSISTPTLNQTSPLFHVANNGIASTYLIMFNSTGSNWYNVYNWYYTVSDDNNVQQTQLVRNISTTGALVSFNSAYSVGQLDYADISHSPPSGSSQIYIILFAVAYGFDFTSTSSSTIYSFPVGAELKYTLPSNYPPNLPTGYLL
jgi:hypothetical protein